MALAADIVPQTTVEDSEELYRRVASGFNYCKKTEDGWHVSASAFGDREQKVSVDRASLCDNDPTRTQIELADGIALLIAGEVRRISRQGLNPNRNDGEPKLLTYNIDVIHRPTHENPAHTQVEPSPPYKTGNVFKKIREALALLAAKRPWLIEPEEIRGAKP